MFALVEDLPVKVFLGFTTLLVVIAAYVKYSYGYWKRRKVPYLEPKFPLGNSDFFIPKGISIGSISKKFYDEFKFMGHKFGGVYFGVDPKLVLVDPDLIKDVLIKDFQSFTDRGVYQTDSDPISVNIFSQPGIEWRNTRTKLTSVFTSAKMKWMFHLMVDCTQGLKGALEKLADQKADVDILEVIGCFTTDVIGSCAFGIECNSFKNPDAEFRKMGKKFFSEFNFMDKMNLFVTIYTPNLAQKLNARNIQKDVSRFFFRSVQETVSYREKNNITRDDLLQLLIDLKNSEVQLTFNELVGQVFSFFIAGFETSSTTTGMALFELSKNHEVQNKVREEIREVLKKYNGEMTYDAIKEMKYLGQVVDETLRLWPSLPTLTRVCTKDYTFRNTDVTVEKGVHLIIPALGLQLDPEYWPDPMHFDPERFSEENKKNIHPCTFLPFGDGPRNCIGLRFGLLQTKIAMVTVLRDYKVTLSPKIVTPLKRIQETFVLRTENKAYLRLEKLSQC